MFFLAFFPADTDHESGRMGDEAEGSNGDGASRVAAPKKVLFAKRVRKGNVRARSSKDDLEDGEENGASSSVVVAKSKSKPRADAFTTAGGDDKKVSFRAMSFRLG